MSRLTLARAYVVAALVALAACSDNSTAPSGSPLGSYPLAFVLGVPMPATVKDPPTQMWIQYSGGALLLRADGTFDIKFNGQFRDYDIPVNAHYAGTFQWTKETGAITLDAANEDFQFRGTVVADTVGVYGYGGLSTVPFPGQPWDLMFVRARR